MAQEITKEEITKKGFPLRPETMAGEEETGERGTKQIGKIGGEVLREVREAEGTLEAEIEKGREEEFFLEEKTKDIEKERDIKEVKAPSEKKLDDLETDLAGAIESNLDCQVILRQISDQAIEKFGDDQQKIVDYIREVSSKVSRNNSSTEGNIMAELERIIAEKLSTKAF